MSDAIPNLGPFILVQASIGIAIVGSAVVAWVRGTRDKRSPAPPVLTEGSLMTLTNLLKGILRLLQEIKEQHHDDMGERRVARDRLNDLLHQIKDKR